MNNKKYERFEKCKGLSLRRDKEYPGTWYDPFPTERYSYAYFVVGFEKVYVVYDYKEEKVIWNQATKECSGRAVWEAMRPEHHKYFLFDIDWFLGS